MASYFCQICGMDMSVARIRTPHDPEDAAWGFDGCNYVGFSPFRDFNGDEFQDEECQQCTTVDRTPTTFYEDAQMLVYHYLPSVEDDDSDGEWLPEDHSDTSTEPLEYDSEAESDASLDVSPQGASHNVDDDYDRDIRSALREMYATPFPGRLPDGTWRDGRIYCRDRGCPLLFSASGKLVYESLTDPNIRLPAEHIAAPSCRSLQGINGHVLSAEEMKNCRTHRFLLAKPPDWQPDSSDGIFENESSLILSGESSGSIMSSFFPHVHPPLYGVNEIKTWTLYTNGGCIDSDGWKPLPVHSYCLDIYAKASYHKLGRVDLDGIWHWREMQSNPESYGLSEDQVLPCPEVSRGRENLDDPWCHRDGDEWLAANPVEIRELNGDIERLFTLETTWNRSPQPKVHFLALPTELVDIILSFLDESNLNAAADTCSFLRHHTQSPFRALIYNKRGWLWEILEGARYPKSPDHPPTWDPCFPPGFISPDLPPGLPTVEDEHALWEQILEEDPEMHSASEAAKILNFLRRETVLASFRGSQKWSLREWQGFRNEVADWIRCPRLPNTEKAHSLDWVRLWRFFNPSSTPIKGLRNRARIWMDCDRILEYNSRMLEDERMDAKQMKVREVMNMDNASWWEQARAGGRHAGL